MRKTLTGRKIQENAPIRKPTELIIETKCPHKWFFVDIEDGKIYKPYTRHGYFRNWREPTAADLKDIQVTLIEETVRQKYEKK